MSAIGKEMISAISLIGLGIGGFLLFKKYINNETEKCEEVESFKLVDRKTIIYILETINYRMKFYNRLAFSINKQTEGLPKKE